MIEKMHGYDYFEDETGEVKAVQRSTGEIVDAVLSYLPVGTKSYTPESQEAYRKHKEMMSKKLLRKITSNELGDFFFVLKNEVFDDISPETVTRLIYLNTFIDYHNNKLMKNKKTPIYRKDLSSILNVSKATASRFWQETNPKYILEHEDGLIFTDCQTFVKGKLPVSRNYKTYQKFYINGIRKLYQSTITSNHKHLGYIFKLLPYINIEYNVLCYNPLETDINEILFMSISEFCNEIKFDKSHINRLLTIYKNTRFEVKNGQERFCSFTYDGLNREKAKIYINPHILFSGTNYNAVEVLGAFCKD